MDKTSQPKLLRVKFLPLHILQFRWFHGLGSSQCSLSYTLWKSSGAIENAASRPRGHGESQGGRAKHVLVCPLGISGKLTRDPEFWKLPGVVLLLSACGGPSQGPVTWGGRVDDLDCCPRDNWESMMEEASWASDRMWNIRITRRQEHSTFAYTTRSLCACS